MHAYDIEMLSRPADRAAGDNHGWCFGLPPGITPAQWPLDRNTGYPLQHGFTLLLPGEYRVRSAECVAIAFFAHGLSYDGRTKIDGIRAALDSTDTDPPGDPGLLPFWHAGHAAHRRLARMEDKLGFDYAAISQTQVEFDGPLFPPPPLVASSLLGRIEPPRWLKVGSAAAFVESPSARDGLLSDDPGFDPNGTRPGPALAYNRALRWTARADDPNAGKVPSEPDSAEQTDYEQPFYFVGDGPDAEYREQAWTEDHQPNHIGGTMRPVQQVPRFSQYYIEFEEWLGGYNFGGGNAQLDLLTMAFDWAC